MLANIFEGKGPIVASLHQPLFSREKELYAGAAASAEMTLKAVDRVVQEREQQFFFRFLIAPTMANIEIGERCQSAVAKQRQ